MRIHQPRPNMRKCADCPRYTPMWHWWWDAELGNEIPVCAKCHRERMQRGPHVLVG